jgi:hypothetical protein
VLAPEKWLYTLRNHLVHGVSTWNSSVNRARVTDVALIRGDVVPNPEVLWR